MTAGQHKGELLRFVDAPGQGDDARIAALFSAALPMGRTPDPVRRLVASRLRAVASQRTGRRRQVLRVAVAMVVLFGFGGVVGAAVYHRLVRPAPVIYQLPGGEVAKTNKGITRPRRKVPPVVALAPDPAPESVLPSKPQGAAVVRRPSEDPPRESRRANSRPRPRQNNQAPMQPTPSESAPTLAPELAISEHTMLADVIRSLRVDAQPLRALQILHAYDERFPVGTLRPESRNLQVQALLALKRDTQALAVLDELLREDLPGRAGRLVLRAEIRLAQGDASLALLDLDDVLRAPDRLSDSLHERALWARAAARDQVGDRADARRDLETYLQRFPNGRFSARARARTDR